MSKVCSINGFEIDLIFSNDEQNIIAVEARSELFFDSLECSIGEHKGLLEKILPPSSLLP